ncbi:MAG TPA: carboxyltransferase domain-containing protein [Actinomycetota bacterium]|nr:carboxyltransferase domain-containing protein [Actinomycetota bacterium]
MSTKFQIERMGDRGIVAVFGEEPSPDLTMRMLGFCVAASSIDGVVDASSGHARVLVEVEPDDFERVATQLETLQIEPDAESEFRTHQLRCRYDGEDLTWAADYLGRSKEQIVGLHSGATYTVVTLGSPGFVYLSEVDERLRLPRMERPRLGVEAGSVGIGGRQTGIYGKQRPGGWRIIGRVDLPLPEFKPGDSVIFDPA